MTDKIRDSDGRSTDFSTDTSIDERLADLRADHDDLDGVVVELLERIGQLEQRLSELEAFNGDRVVGGEGDMVASDTQAVTGPLAQDVHGSGGPR